MDNFIYTIVLFIAIGGMLITWWNDHQENKRMEEEEEERKAQAEKTVQHPVASSAEIWQTRDFFLDTLTRIGCQYHITEDENKSIIFNYQGEQFISYATNESAYVSVWDTYWKEAELDDIDEISRLRKVINIANTNTQITSIYSICEDNRKMCCHSKTKMVFIHAIPDIEDYLRAQLNQFFYVHQVVELEMQKLRETERCSG